MFFKKIYEWDEQKKNLQKEKKNPSKKDQHAIGKEQNYCLCSSQWNWFPPIERNI